MFVNKVSEKRCNFYQYHLTVKAYIKCKFHGKISKVRLNADNVTNLEILVISNVNNNDEVFIFGRTDPPPFPKKTKTKKKITQKRRRLYQESTIKTWSREVFFSLQ